jgi:hypothetical protein
MGTKSFNLTTPSRSSFNDEMNESTKLFWFMPPVFSSQKTQITYSSEQALMELGVNFDFLRSGLKTNFQISGSNDHTTMFMLVKSIYFNVTVDYPSKPSDFFGYETDVENLLRQDEDDWNRLLVQVRRDRDQIVFPIVFLRNLEPVTAYFIVEGNEVSLSVSIPTLVLTEFVTEVTFFQHLLRTVALFAGKNSSTVRFTLGAVSMQWDELVERGCAREVDIGF